MENFYKSQKFGLKSREKLELEMINKSTKPRIWPKYLKISYISSHFAYRNFCRYSNLP